MNKIQGGKKFNFKIKNMKINKIISFSMASLMLMFSACEPIVDEELLINTANFTDVELVATQSTVGGNEITFEMNTSNVTGYWDYMIGKGLTDRVTVVFPVTGTFDFKYVGTLGAEFFEKVIPVEITKLDTPVALEWAALLGDDAVAGKTWVFDGTSGDNGLWWYMASGGPDNDPVWDSVWWNAGGGGDAPSDVNGKMHFDLDGAANFTYYSDANSGTNELGTFVLDTDGMTLKINGSNILGSEEPRGNPGGSYTIISLTSDKMILFVPDNAGGTGWTWIFKPE